MNRMIFFYESLIVYAFSWEFIFKGSMNKGSAFINDISFNFSGTD